MGIRVRGESTCTHNYQSNQVLTAHSTEVDFCQTQPSAPNSRRHRQKKRQKKQWAVHCSDGGLYASISSRFCNRLAGSNVPGGATRTMAAGRVARGSAHPRPAGCLTNFTPNGASHDSGSYPCCNKVSRPPDGSSACTAS